MSPENYDLLRAHYEDLRSEINHKVAWCCALPPLGWFGRIDRLAAEHARLNKVIHDLIRAAYAPSSAKPAADFSPGTNNK